MPSFLYTLGYDFSSYHSDPFPAVLSKQITSIHSGRYFSLIVYKSGEFFVNGRLYSQDGHGFMDIHDRTEITKFSGKEIKVACTDDSIAINSEGKVYVVDVRNRLEKPKEILLIHGEDPYCLVINELEFDQEIVNVFGGAKTFFAVAVDGSVFYWGQNCFEDGTIFTKKPTKLQFKFLQNENIIDIKASYYYAVFLTDKGEVYKTGFNAFNSIGKENNLSKSSDEIRIEAFKDLRISKICTAMKYILALTTDGKLYQYGEMDGFGKQSNPILIEINGKVIHIEAAEKFAIAVTENNEQRKVFVWGQPPEYMMIDTNEEISEVNIVNKIEGIETVTFNASFMTIYARNIISEQKLKEEIQKLGEELFSKQNAEHVEQLEEEIRSLKMQLETVMDDMRKQQELIKVREEEIYHQKQKLDVSHSTQQELENKVYMPSATYHPQIDTLIKELKMEKVKDTPSTPPDEEDEPIQEKPPKMKPPPINTKDLENPFSPDSPKDSNSDEDEEERKKLKEIEDIATNMLEHDPGTGPSQNAKSPEASDNNLLNTPAFYFLKPLDPLINNTP